MNERRRRLAATFVLLGLVAAGVAAGPRSADRGAPPVRAPKPDIVIPHRIDAAHLPNVVVVHPRVISGGQPEGEAGFAELRDLGVKTVVSVDGAKPDIALAEKYGLRYVHLPHGYDGIPDGRAKELAKVVRDLPGPVYVHCHHGRHRSPAAAAVACVAAGLIEPESARGVLELAGTSEHYRGLYESAETVRPVEEDILDTLAADFPGTVEVPPMAEAMVEIEHSHDRMTAVAAADWKSPPKHPDVDPAHEALLLRELFTELLRTEDVRNRPERFRALLRESERAGEDLETSLRAGDDAGARAAFDRITTNCAACHRAFRDIPLDEKP